MTANPLLDVLTDPPYAGPQRDFVGYGRKGLKVHWPNGAKVALTLVVNYETGAEASWPAGDRRNDKIFEFPYVLDPRFRDLAQESVAEYGSRAGVWRIARMLDDLKMRCTFSGCAVAFARNPEVGAYVKEAGHEGSSHGYRWEEVWNFSRQQEKERIAAAVEIIRETCGERPIGWQTRHSGSLNTRELLVEEGGFLYDCDSTADDLPYYVTVGGKRHLIVPYSSTYNDHRFIIAQGYSRPQDFFDYCREGIDYLRREGETRPKMMTVAVHAHWVGQAARTAALHRFLEYVLGTGDVWVARRRDIAEWFSENYDTFVRDTEAEA
ncbi:polysaccharide deacetylase family protein [Consotaella salsifontis]|uniref:Chitooligosaccharide deacetylase n=1 Tax=Consotaella salsifontis TaxID=1365950 RepID=A0A1T4T1Z4_9HYPH|nr:polysaccharide deacetylase family protein [Consotaella salsifontis]SKA34251.1 Peptidoglycan/xylan/chitin deacetylase, PgdA/CDA1 family [Consotaella salsifontis]